MAMRRIGSGQQAQMTLEYIIIFSVVGLLTMVTLTRWDNNVRAALEQLFLNLVDKLQ